MPSIQEQLLASILRGEHEVKNRQHLGAMVPIQLFQALRLVGMGSAIEDMVGDGADALVYRSGQSLGEILGNVALPQADNDLAKYVGLIRSICLKLSIGQVVVEKVALQDDLIKLRVDECVSCAGLEAADRPICHFEAGMVGGIVRTFTKTPVRAVETRCNAVGDGTCGIDVHILNRS